MISSTEGKGGGGLGWAEKTISLSYCREGNEHRKQGGEGRFGSLFSEAGSLCSPLEPTGAGWAVVLLVRGLRRRLEHRQAETPSDPSDPAVLGLAAAAQLCH